MSRSIHTTRRQQDEAERREYATAEERTAQLERITEELARKRRIKEQRQAERRRGDGPLPPTEPELIPIQVRDQGTFIHYPATVEDIRGVMRLLPKGVLDGLSGIALCLGMEDQERNSDTWYARDDEPDPLVGRRGVQLWSGVYTGRTLGTYYLASAKIHLLAYVYDGQMPDRAIKELFLRLQMLATFVHEVAHHYDFTVRVARGRWLAEVTDKAEAFARRTQLDHTQRYVIPYLQQAYPEDVRALDAWIEHHGGTRVPLSMLAGDLQAYLEDNGVKLFFHVAGAFESLVEDVTLRKDATTTRIEFARELHYGTNYAEALASLDRVLREHPDHPQALTLQADIAVHQEEYDRAEELCQRVLTGDGASVDTWEVLADVYHARRDWAQMLDAATHGMDLNGEEDTDWPRLLSFHARALLELRDFQQLELDIDVLSEVRSGYRRRESDALRAMMLLRTGRYEGALECAVTALIEPARPTQRRFCRELAAVRFEAAHRLGRPDEAGELAAEDLKDLREAGHEAWMDRLEAEFGLRSSG